MSQGSGHNYAVAGVMQVMLAAGLWATVGVSTKLVASAGMVPQEVLSLARLAVGGPALLLLVAALARSSLSEVWKLNPQWLTSFVLGCAVFQLCLFQAFLLLEVTTTVFITVCLPPLMATAVSLLRDDRSITLGTQISLGLGILGLAAFTLDGFSAGIDGPKLFGLALAVLAAAAFVQMTSAARRLTLASSPLVVAGTGLTLAAVLLCVMLPFVRLDTGTSAQIIPWELAGFILYLGLGPTALAYVLFCSGMARCRSANVGLIASMVEPAFAALLAWLLLNERLSATEVFGCALVMLAMLTLCKSERMRWGKSPALPTAEGVRP
jgi:drug/metabolite transporter, DME family